MINEREEKKIEKKIYKFLVNLILVKVLKVYIGERIIFLWNGFGKVDICGEDWNRFYFLI